jgi:hypothetical protein
MPGAQDGDTQPGVSESQKIRVGCGSPAHHLSLPPLPRSVWQEQISDVGEAEPDPPQSPRPLHPSINAKA